MSGGGIREGEKCMVQKGEIDHRSDATRLQDRVIDGAISSLDAGRDVFIMAPTGSGKSRKFSVIAAQRALAGQRVIVMAHRQKLVHQAAENMERWAPRPVETSIGMHGHIDQSGDVVYSTIQTAHERRGHLERYDIAIFDEAHHVTDKNVEYRETIEALRRQNPDIQFIGLSATPPDGYHGLDHALQRADRHVITFEEAIAARLVRLPDTKTPRMLYNTHDSLEDVVERHRKSRTSGSFESGIAKQIGQMRGDDWAEQLANQYERVLGERRSLCFFDSIREAKAFAAEMEERGIPVATIHSGQSLKQNDAHRLAYENRKVNALISVDMISEGYDIDCDGILLDKKTTSATEYKQIIGRESRGHGRDDDERGKAILLDTGASTLMHGDIAILAQMQTTQGNLERKTLSGPDFLPTSPDQRFKGWVQLDMPETGAKAWGTNLNNTIVYVTEMEKGFAAFHKVKQGKTEQIKLLSIEGQSVMGRFTGETLGDWIAKSVQKNGSSITNLMAKNKAGVTRLEAMISDDWKKSASSVKSSVEMFSRFPAPAMAQQAERQRAMA
jgi:superfamily II DNA or RNA helicase